MKTLTLSVVQFNTFVKNIFDAEEFLHDISIFGEVTNFKISGANAYFDLKDEGALLSCVKFGADGLNIKNGDRVTVFGKVNFYVKSGRLNFIVARAAAAGMGDLYQRFLELKEKLEKQGLFKEEIKKSIPKFAKKVGVVTSETGAVIRDIIHVARRKNPYTDIIVFPSKVQGIGAEDELCKGIEYFNSRNDIDTIIVARGGGSIEDLAPFNTEKIVKAIYSSSIPVISAVGHETDFTLSDFASDLRVPTPSVAAEVAFFDYFEQLNFIGQLSEANYYFVSRLLKQNQNNLFNFQSQVIDKTKLKLGESKSKLFSLVKDIENLADKNIKACENKINASIAVIDKLNPLKILKNGYAVIQQGNKRLNSVNNVDVGENILIKLCDGEISATVTNKSLKENNLWHLKKLYKN